MYSCLSKKHVCYIAQNFILTKIHFDLETISVI
nr:MAG TPA: hypothetical protein [Caudoviricetes sp.]